MIVADKYKIELGKIKQHKEQKMRVLLTNTDVDNLIRFSVWSGCGCTLPVADSYKIEPNSSTTLHATFDASKLGVQVKVFGIEYTDRVNGHQRISIEFTAEVEE